MAFSGALISARPASVDRLRSRDTAVGIQLASIVAFAALTAFGAQIRLYLWEVPFTLQTLAVYGSGLFLGARNGALAQALYVLAGLVLPVYAGGGVGPAYLFGAASAGYLIAFVPTSFLVGRLSERWNSLLGSTLALLAGSLVLFTVGVTWLHFAADHATWFESIDRGWLRFLPADLAKIFLAGGAYAGARRLVRR